MRWTDYARKAKQLARRFPEGNPWREYWLKVAATTAGWPGEMDGANNYDQHMLTALEVETAEREKCRNAA